ncbi:MAG: PLP-dependent aminotransferase family protein [Anaerolineae bacterium]|nr:PLP-dependent aminotransferase family protein [Anaerolineae bacterium]
MSLPIQPVETEVTTNWDAKLASRAVKMTSSVIRELLKLTEKPDIISFAGGLPAAELFPIREFREACEYVLTTNGSKALQYGATEGYTPLREYLSEKMQKYGVPAEVENIIITNGSQQALDLIGRIFLDKGDVVITERPTYLGALQAWRAYEPQFATVPLDDDGMCVDQLEPVLKAHQGKVKFIYVLPNFHNPAGTTLPLERRIELVHLAAKYGVPIIEDDPYGELRFEGEDITPIETLHKENVIYLSTFSKTLAPGIRIGWVTAPSKIIGKLVQAKQGADLHTGVFVQMVAHDICSRGLLRSHVKKVREAYLERRDAMLHAMEEYFPSGVTWTRPQGGLFLWVRLPPQIDTTEFMKTALEEKVAYVPGAAFYPDEGDHNAMRLNFSYCRPEIIREGIQRLARAIMREFG